MIESNIDIKSEVFNLPAQVQSSCYLCVTNNLAFEKDGSIPDLHSGSPYAYPCVCSVARSVPAEEVRSRCVLMRISDHGGATPFFRFARNLEHGAFFEDIMLSGPENPQ